LSAVFRVQVLCNAHTCAVYLGAQTFVSRLSWEWEWR